MAEIGADFFLEKKKFQECPQEILESLLNYQKISAKFLQNFLKHFLRLTECICKMFLFSSKISVKFCRKNSENFHTTYMVFKYSM